MLHCIQIEINVGVHTFFKYSLLLFWIVFLRSQNSVCANNSLTHLIRCKVNFVKSIWESNSSLRMSMKFWKFVKKRNGQKLFILNSFSSWFWIKTFVLVKISSKIKKVWRSLWKDTFGLFRHFNNRTIGDKIRDKDSTHSLFSFIKALNSLISSAFWCIVAFFVVFAFSS